MLPGELLSSECVFSFLLKSNHRVAARVGDSANCRTQLSSSGQVWLIEVVQIGYSCERDASALLCSIIFGNFPFSFHKN